MYIICTSTTSLFVYRRDKQQQEVLNLTCIKTWLPDRKPELQVAVHAKNRPYIYIQGQLRATDTLAEDHRAEEPRVEEHIYEELPDERFISENLLESTQRVHKIIARKPNLTDGYKVVMVSKGNPHLTEES